MPTKLDNVTTPPTYTGIAGKAWKGDIEAMRVSAKAKRGEDATVCCWVVEAAWAHPLWHSYWLVLIHLRSLPNQKREIKFYLEGATHELWLYALDPDKPRQEMLDTGRMKLLTPMNFSAQIIEDSDQVAAYLIEQAVKDICAGKLNPDTDFIRQWAQRFGDNMMLK